MLTRIFGRAKRLSLVQIIIRFALNCSQLNPGEQFGPSQTCSPRNGSGCWVILPTCGTSEINTTRRGQKKVFYLPFSKNPPRHDDEGDFDLFRLQTLPSNNSGCPAVCVDRSVPEKTIYPTIPWCPDHLFPFWRSPRLHFRCSPKFLSWGR
jgi:hypothetical protein